ncbi:hypothetical protein AVEN_6617-1 [Araneus ventricosus]|uniref:Uncharacterized protein n=1 Tax=Araneus ventricosus TaxID=182803 RepID=A0A4Y2L034_ARAVE|nr:hypothetical protein AVEN_6617-1 [Araneus ventricosus]
MILNLKILEIRFRSSLWKSSSPPGLSLGSPSGLGSNPELCSTCSVFAMFAMSWTNLHLGFVVVTSKLALTVAASLFHCTSCRVLILQIAVHAKLSTSIWRPFLSFK